MRKLCSLVAIMMLSACSSLKNDITPIPAPNTELGNSVNTEQKILKSPNDKRLYRAFTLANNLEVMLISDPESDKAAASMDVLVGSADDPADYPGLAHFLEHMLFLGTEKYPEPDAYQKFISDHGGRHNAYTSSQHTNYFFEVSSDYLEGALDRFSQQFTSPLFNEEYVGREVNAVHSEYTSRLKDDGRRYYSVLKETLAKDHPFNKFSVGNLKTLNGNGQEALKQALLDFYAANYSANLMKLVIFGKDSLDELEAIAKSKFSSIPNRNIKRDKISKDFFEEGFLPAKISIQSIKDKRSLGLAFPIPSPHEHYDSKPSSYLANLIGHEGTGSLLSALKEAQLVDTLSAGTYFDTQVKAIFSVNMGLTQKGLQHTDQILEFFFAYINLIKTGFDLAPDMQKTYFDEMATMLGISFRFQEKASPMNYARAIADALHLSPPETVLAKGYEMDEYDASLYQSYLEYLSPKNMLVTVSAQSVEGDQTSPWYDTPYRVESVDKQLIDQLSQVSLKNELKLPKENLFIPQNVSFVDAIDDAIPTQVYKSEGIELWHAVDHSFGTPKSDLFITIRSPEAMTSAASLNSLELMVSLLKDALNEFSYPAYLAGLNYELYNHVRGVTVKISGYSDKQSVLLDQILGYLKNKPFTQDRFDIIKENLQRGLENKAKQKPYEQAIALVQENMLNPSWSTEERLEALKKINLESLESFRAKFFSKLQLAVLSAGNITENQAIDLSKQLETSLLDGAKRVTVSRAEALKLDEKETLFGTKTVTHPDTGFVFYLQGQSKEYKEQARFSLIAQLISSDYYNDIRTEKQLGYIVFATHFPVQDVPGLGFIVQSPVMSGPDLYEETKSFLSTQTEKLKELDPDQFERAKTSVISKLQKKDNTLYEKSNRYWREIDRENANFDTRDQIIEAINALELNEVVDYFAKIAQTKGQKLLIYTTNETLNGKVPEDLKDIMDVSFDTRVYF